MIELGLLAKFVGTILQVVVMLVIIQFVIGLLFAFNVVSPSNEFLRQVYEAINRLLDPVLRPIRNLMPNTGMIDFSPLVLIMGLSFVQWTLEAYAA